MSASGNFIQYVFLNENDVYYSGSLLKLNYKQVLWNDLTKAQYTDVYFLKPDGKGFSVSAFPKKGRTGFARSVANTALKKTLDNTLDEWMTSGAAVVISLQDFCDAFSGRNGKSTADLIRSGKGKWKGTIVLTVPVTVEQSYTLFMENPVFEAINENAVINARQGKGKDFYSVIKRNKGSACRFLNTITPEAVEAILLHISFEKPAVPVWDMNTRIAAEYLAQYLRNPQLQNEDDFFLKKGVRYDVFFRDLYRILGQTDVLRALHRKTVEIEAEGTLQVYMDNREIAYEAVDQVTMCREKHSYADRCLDIRIPYSEPVETDWIDVTKTLQEIRSRALLPLAGKENPELVKAIEEFTGNLAVYQSAKDYDSWNRALYAIKTCFLLLYEDTSTEKGKNNASIGKILKRYVGTSYAYFTMSKDLEHYRHTSGKRELTAHSIKKMEETIESLRRQLEYDQDMVLASLINYSSNSNSEDILASTKALDSDIKKYEPMFSGQQNEDQEEHFDLDEEPMAPDTELPKPPVSLDEEDYSMYEIDDDDDYYDYRPPSLRN